MKTKIIGMRWYIVGMLCLATGLNYLDRQTLAVLAATIMKELNISTAEYSYITTAFLISYTIMYAVSGRLVDLLGTRKSFAIFVGGWSIANALHAFARTAMHFSVFRFLLGATEPANFPAGVKAVTEWFPVRERALAIGIFNSGTAVGGALAAPLLSFIAIHWGWRAAFVLGGALGGFWVVVWLLVYRLPREHPRVTAEELALIEGDHLPERTSTKAVSTGRILRMPEAWGCIAARMLTDPLSYFFIFWIPLFLAKERGFNQADIGKYLWIPYVALGVGNIVGGMVPRYLIQCGWTLDRARKTVMACASVVIPICCLATTRVPSPVWAVALISTAMFCHACWANITLPAEVFPKHVVGTVSGFGGCVGAAIGVLATLVIGWTVEHYSFTPVFMVMAFLPLTAFLLVCVLVKNLGQVREVND